MKVINLTCNYQANPIGLDDPAPRLSWQLSSREPGARQTKFHVLVSTSPALLRKDIGDVWDSGLVASPQSHLVPYLGPVLRSRQRVWWKVRVWDQTGVAAAWSSPAHWEMGLLDRADWKAGWISAGWFGGPRTTSPAPYLRREFKVSGAAVRARLYVTALGLFEAEINGTRVGNDVFTPGWTDYNQRVQVLTYDVTDLLTSGDNALGVILGDGWYCGHVAWLHRQNYGERPALLAQLEIELSDGGRTVINSDESWHCSPGPILESDLLMGESYDARRALPGWSAVGYMASAWQPVQIAPVAVRALAAQIGAPVRRVVELKPVTKPVHQGMPPSPKYVYDLGQNMTGWVRLKVRGERGSTVSLRFAEVLNANGTIYTTNLRGARATDHYTLSGDGVETFEPRFTFHGFRYVEVSGLQGEPLDDAITGIVVHSDMSQTGTFACSDPLINQLQHNIEWGQRGNFVDVPTDCPQRDERAGWTGDAQAFIRTAAFNFDVANVFARWHVNLIDAQRADGSVPPVIPNPKLLPMDGGPAWSDAAIICPWTMYLTYGDHRMLERNYASMQRYIAYMEATARDDIRVHAATEGWHGFGDWLSINADTPKDLIGTAFFAHDARLMARIARILDRVDDAARYKALGERVREAFVRRFCTGEGAVAVDTQTAMVLALHFNLLAPAQRAATADALVRNIRARGNHLSTGFVGAPYLNHVLAGNGALDVAYDLLNQTSWPSWLYSVTKGATTIWERWDGWTHDKGFQDPGMNSFNHYAYGAIGDWLYQVVAGIDVDEQAPGYARIVLKPQPGGGLTWAKATYQSPYGEVVSDWRINKDTFKWRIVIPPNTTAEATAPGETQPRTLAAGEHKMTVRMAR